jgi:hypothetical protein
MSQKAEGRRQKAEAIGAPSCHESAAPSCHPELAKRGEGSPDSCAGAANRRGSFAVFAAQDDRAVGTQHSALSTQHYAVALIIILLAPQVFACSVCYGAPGDPLVKGANNGIMFLLGIIGFVQIGFIAMFWSFWRKAREQRRFRESLRLIEGGPRS